MNRSFSLNKISKSLRLSRPCNFRINLHIERSQNWNPRREERNILVPGNHRRPLDPPSRMGVPKRGSIRRKLPEREPGKLFQPFEQQQREQQRVGLWKRRERGDRRCRWFGFLQRERKREGRLDRRWLHRWRVLLEIGEQWQRSERSSKIGEPGSGKSSESELEPEPGPLESSAGDPSLGPDLPPREKERVGEHEQRGWAPTSNNEQPRKNIGQATDQRGGGAEQ